VKLLELLSFLIIFLISVPQVFSYSNTEILGCVHGSKIAKISIKHQLEPLLLKSRPEESHLLKLSKEHLKSFHGIFHYGLSKNGELYSLIPSEEEVKIIKEGKDFYYEASLVADYCGAATSSVKMDVPLPGTLDSNYKFIKKHSFRRIRFNNTVKEVFPCTDEEFLNFDSSDLWYTWNPFKIGLDADGRHFSCPEMLKDFPKALVKIDYESKKIKKIQKNENIYSEITVVFGKVSPKASVEDIKKYFHDLKKAETFSSPEVIDKNFDLHAISNFIHYLNKRYRITKVPLIDDHSISLKVNINNREIIIKIFYFETEVNQSSSYFSEKILSLLENSDIFIYIGHSGFGKSLNLHQLNQTLKLTDSELKMRLRTKKHQVIGINSCFASSYFGPDIIKLRDGLTTDLFLSMNSRYVPNFPLFMIEKFIEKTGNDFYPKDWHGKYNLKRIYHE